MSYTKDDLGMDNTFNEIRNRSGEEQLENKLKTVWLTEGYSKNSVKEYFDNLQKELDYQKGSFEIQLKSIIDEKERLLSEKKILSKQLEDAVANLANSSNEDKIKEYEDRIIHLEEVIEGNKNSLDEYSGIINDLRSQIMEANSEIDNLRNNGSYVAEDENLQLIEELKQLKAENEDLKERLLSSNNESKDNHLDVIKMQADNNLKLLEDNQKLTSHVSSLSDMMQELIKREKEHNQQMQEISVMYDEEMAKYENIIDEYKAGCESMKENLDLLNEENTELRNKLIASKDYISEKNDKIEYLESANNILMKQLEEQREKNRKISGIDHSSILQ